MALLEDLDESMLLARYISTHGGAWPVAMAATHALQSRAGGGRQASSLLPSFELNSAPISQGTHAGRPISVPTVKSPGEALFPPSATWAPPASSSLNSSDSGSGVGGGGGGGGGPRNVSKRDLFRSASEVTRPRGNLDEPLFAPRVVDVDTPRRRRVSGISLLLASAESI